MDIKAAAHPIVLADGHTLQKGLTKLEYTYIHILAAISSNPEGLLMHQIANEAYRQAVVACEFFATEPKKYFVDGSGNVKGVE